MQTNPDHPKYLRRWREILTELAPDLTRSDEDTNTSCLLQARRAGLSPENERIALGRLLDCPPLDDVLNATASARFVERIPIGYARQYILLGLTGEDDKIRMAMGDLDSWSQIDVLGRLLERPIQPTLAPAEQVLAAINLAYQTREGQAQAAIDSLGDRPVLDGELRLDREDLLDVSGRAPVIQLVNAIFFEAVKSRASDVHFQPYEERLVVRLRIDGVLFDCFQLGKDVQEEVISRLKIIGRMNIAEKRLPQDGRATVQLGDRLIDLRIASLPTSHGERVVVRLLDKSSRVHSLGELGMEDDTLRQYSQLIGMEHGLILVTGPTGSGKSTTLYAALQQLDTKDKNVVTLEDPIEYQLEGVSQTQVSEKKGMTFAGGLRSVLRQDPDVIMVGEIRDRETAVMAIQSALTGHLVFSTLHTNDAASAITRLLDLGIEHYLVSSSVVAVLAQRLVRSICPNCATGVDLSADQLRELITDDIPRAEIQIQKGVGCDDCRGTGYQGRIGIFELLLVTDRVRREIQGRAHAAEIRQSAVTAGMRLLREDGVRKMLSGKTTLEEVQRVTMRGDV